MTLEDFMEEYKTLTPKSKALFDKALCSLPGGVSANIKYYEPYPIFMEKGKGAWLTDADGNRYVDYLGSYGPLILGHGHPAVNKAIESQLEDNGTLLYGTPHELECRFAQKIKELYPSIELLRYTNSGTEATLFTLRMAYAYTGKYKIGKFEGHYHGGYNQVLVSVNPDIASAGDIHNPTPLPESKGLEPYQLENTIILPFNDLEACTRILKENQHEMAAIIMEPIQSGYIPATKEFMRGIRKVTAELGILLIFDEVKTGFRAGLKGAQGLYDIKPDLTALGKVIGGGMPMGIVGGRKDIMMVTAPVKDSDVFDAGTGKRSSSRDVLFHSGTYNGHPLILRIGLAVIEVLEKEFDSVAARTGILKKELEKLFYAKGIRILTLGEATVFNYAITESEKILNYRDFQKSDFTTRKKIDFALFKEGIYNKPTNRYSLSTAHDDKIIDFTLEAFKKALQRI